MTTLSTHGGVMLGLLLSFLAGCGGSENERDTQVTGATRTNSGTGPASDTSPAETTSSGAEGTGGSSAETSGTETADAGPSGSDGNDVDDTVGGGAGPVELYRGPVEGGTVPGWDPQAPRPLLMMGRQGDSWVATLAQIGADGSLSQNVAEEIVVWGWDVAPELVYDGPIGGALEGWDPQTPRPVVMLGYSELQQVWWSTLASIGPGGELGDNVSDRIVVWSWPPADPAAPQSVYAGPLDANAKVPGWSSDDPQPLVMLGRFANADTWQATLASIASDGTLGDNLADEIAVWGW